MIVGMNVLPDESGGRLGFLSLDERPRARRFLVMAYVTAGVSAPVMALLGRPLGHPRISLVLAITIGLWGILLGVLLRNPSRSLVWWHVATAAAFPAIAGAVAVTGGAASPARAWVWLPLLGAALFFRAAPWYLAGALLTEAAPLLYDPHASAVVDFGPVVPIYTVVTVTVSAAKREVVKLRRAAESLSRTDPLTGLANRRLFDERLAHEFAQHQRRGDTFAAVVVDVDHFKTINDTCGHEAGDAALQRIAGTLREACRETDLVARTGGDEFVMLLPSCHLAGASITAERVRRSVESFADGIPTVSIGVAVAPDDAETPEELLRAADAALYQAKAVGRNSVVGQPLLAPELAEPAAA